MADTQICIRKSEEGRKALLDLHAHHLNFTEIVNRGMDPDLLRTLCTKFGIPIASPSPSQLPQVAQPVASGPGAATKADKQSKDSNVRFPIQHNELPANTDQNNSRSDSSFTTATQHETKNTTTPLTALASKNNTTSGLLAKASGKKPAESKGLDRKDYIARMLAAKAGKAAATTNPSVPSEVSTITTSEVAAQSVPFRAAEISNMPDAAHVTPDTDQQARNGARAILPPSLKENADAEVKRKAQTDLARQKIEALKLQQETRRATGNLSTDQNYPFLSDSNSLAQVSAPEPLPRPPVPNRQSSYFSPIGQKAPFSIPGLFMTSEPSPSTKTSEKDPHQHSAAPAQELQEPIRLSEAFQQPPVNMTPDASREPIFEPSNDAETLSAALSTAHRKRRKAVDFLDSASRRIKRPLGQQDDCSFIIDISDDEMADHSDLGSIDTDATDRRVLASNNSQLRDVTSSRQKSTRDFPPLSDFSSLRKKPAMTPPAAPVLHQAKGLKTKEMEIELMNRKIAELEQRINAKRTSSRAHTPGVSGSTTMSPARRQPSQDGGEEPKEVCAETDGHGGHGSPEEVSLVALETADTVSAEQKLHEVELAKAEVERSLAADLAPTPDGEQILQQDQPGAIQKIEQSTRRDEAQSPAPLEAREVEGRQMQSKQLPPICNQELSQCTERIHFRERQESPCPEAEHTPSQREEGLTNPLNEQRRIRRAAIESGLPVLDASMEKTKQKLESLRNEIEALELEVKKGEEGRRALVEELETLPHAKEAQQPSQQEQPFVTDQSGELPEQLPMEETQGKCSFSSGLLRGS